MKSKKYYKKHQKIKKYKTKRNKKSRIFRRKKTFSKRRKYNKHGGMPIQTRSMSRKRKIQELEQPQLQLQPQLPTIFEENQETSSIVQPIVQQQTRNNEQFRQTRELMTQQLANPSQRKANMLSAVCNSDTRGACLDFGIYREQIKFFFDNYLLSSPYPKTMKRIGNPSNNGFILQVEYERDNYKSYSVIKCNQSNENDNLLYEYYVGRIFINEFVPIFPCFVETYEQLYFFNDPSNFNFAKSIDKTGININNNVKNNFREVKNTQNLINPLNEFANNTCKFGKTNSIAIMIQHFNNITSVYDALKNNYNNTIYDLPNILFQVYFVLNILKDEYTHYDLHLSNVFLYKPYTTNKYIEMHYHLNDGKIVTFPTEYIVKIIDYGRNFFKSLKTGVDSQQLFDLFCSNPSAPECVSNNPYDPCNSETSGIFTGEYKDSPGSFYYISPNKKNISHDLRMIYESLQFGNIIKTLFPNASLKYDHRFGTEENINIGGKEFTTIDMTNSNLKSYTIDELVKICDKYNIPYSENDKNNKLTLVNKIQANTTNKIVNVNNAFTFLLEKCYIWNNLKFIGWKTKTLSSEEKYNKYASPKWTKMGDMHIYEDRRPYEFIASAIN